MIKNITVFEICSEVCRKVGGLNTVIKSKIVEIQKKIKNYYLIGFIDDLTNFDEFKRLPIPEKFKNNSNFLRNKGLTIIYGKWLGVKTFLIGSKFLSIKKLNDLKHWLWKNYEINSLNSDNDYDVNLSWSYCVSIFLKKLYDSDFFEIDKSVIHFHEWISGVALIQLRNYCPKLSTVWTTHATIMGRILNGNGFLVSKIVKEKNHVVLKKYENNPRHLIELNCAKITHVLTTVSELTSEECSFFLKRKPEIILNNGLNLKKYQSFLKNSENSKKLILKFLKSYFHPYYSLPLKNCFLTYTSGRNVIHDKGFDLFLKSLKKLNNKLIEEKSNKFLIAFILVPIHDVEPKSFIKNNLKTKKLLKDGVLPPITAFNLRNNVEIIDLIKDNGLINAEKDRVKIIFYPTYLNKNDGLFNKSYEELVTGMDLGVFPSRYEPWGYTPMEAIGLNNLTITTNQTGFSKSINNLEGIKVLKIKEKEENTVNELFSSIRNFFSLNSKDLKKLKKENLMEVQKFNWTILIENYLKAYELVLKRN